MVGSLLACVIGLLGVLWILTSVIRTVVIPRPERVWLTVTAFSVSRRIAHGIARRLPVRYRHGILGAFAPTVLISLPLIWSVGLVGAFAALYWGVDVGSVQESLELSGSSMTTLGFVPAPNATAKALAVVQALVGLAIVALMISFLPTLYGTFSRREISVGKLTTRAGSPPHPVSFLTRLQAIGQLDRVSERWDEWEDWFVELGETHTSFPALVYFRSASPDRSWLTAAETALDTAALVASLQLTAPTGEADTMIRSGFLAVRAIADFYRIEPEAQAGNFDSLSVGRDEFEGVVDALIDAGVAATNVDREEAWNAFAGWRMNYDRSITGLRELVGELPSHWESGGQMPVVIRG